MPRPVKHLGMAHRPGLRDGRGLYCTVDSSVIRRALTSDESGFGGITALADGNLLPIVIEHEEANGRR
jgi:hypothetical protein